MTVSDNLRVFDADQHFYDARVHKMDERGVHAAWMLPTIGMAYEETCAGRLREIPRVAD